MKNFKGIIDEHNFGDDGGLCDNLSDEFLDGGESLRPIFDAINLANTRVIVDKDNIVMGGERKMEFVMCYDNMQFIL